MTLDNSIPLSQNLQDADDPLPEFDKPRQRRILRTERFITSVNTPFKQKSLEAAIKLNFVLYSAIKAKNEREHPHRKFLPYCYVDLNSGRGQDENGEDGSPLIVERLAQEHRIDHSSHLYEIEEDNAQMLQRLLDQRGYCHATVHNHDHNDLLRDMLPLDYFQYGAIYADPSNAAPSWDVLRALKQKAPYMDILINLACASYKRQIKLPEYVHLHNHLFSLKKLWFVREPIGIHQWSILFGTNWVKYPPNEKHNYFSIETAEGRDILNRLVYTHNERLVSDQLSLL